MASDQYDVVIIGAGISGLVCGCYLAKAGMKTLIVEKNARPGGYCSSFIRKGFRFDACAHSLGGLGVNGIVTSILKELDLTKRIKFIRFNPSDVVYAPDGKISFYNESDRTVNDFVRLFPEEEEHIKQFFRYINNSKNFVHAELRNKTFEQLLDCYFSDYKLKSILSVVTLGNLGLPASCLSAFTAVNFYRQFVLDGGYYPEGGIQSLPDLFARRFKELGGSLRGFNKGQRIIINHNIAGGILLENGENIKAKYIISSCDARQTFFNMCEEGRVHEKFLTRLNSLMPSLSMFVLYAGLKGNMPQLPPEGVNFWFLSRYNLEEAFNFVQNERVEVTPWYMLRIIPVNKNLLMFANTTFKNEKYWIHNKKRLIELYIKEAEKNIPSISDFISFKDAATPQELYKWTLNYNGASYGWAAIPSQFAVEGLSQITPIKNLYLTGHWTTLAQGINGVAFVGKNTAEIILHNLTRVMSKNNLSNQLTRKS